jgi:hypothetical protein
MLAGLFLPLYCVTAARGPYMLNLLQTALLGVVAYGAVLAMFLSLAGTAIWLVRWVVRIPTPPPVSLEDDLLEDASERMQRLFASRAFAPPPFRSGRNPGD